MAFTRFEKDVKVHQSLPDDPNIDNGISAEDLKKMWDKPAEDLKEAFNKLEDELEDIREGYEASRSISAAKIYDGDDSDGNVQAKLTKLKQIMDGITQGAVPDGSIGREKLNFADTIPTNDQMGVLYLASKYTKPVNVGETVETYVTPSLTSDNRQGYVVTSTKSADFDIYTFIGGSGANSLYGSSEPGYPGTNGELIIEFPFVIQISKIALTCFRDGINGFVTCSGSTDGVNYVSLPGFSVPSTDDETYRSLSITTPNFYKYIKFSYGSNYDIFDAGAIYNNIVITGKKLTALDSANKLQISTEGNAKMTAYEEGQIVKIETPSTYVTGDNVVSTLDINSIGAKLLPIDLEPSTKYTLVYNGTAFEKEV